MSKVLSHQTKRLLGLLAILAGGFLLFLYSQQYISTNVLVADLADAEDSANQQNHIKGQYDQVKNLKNEVKNIQRDLKNGDFTAVNAEIANFESCLNRIQSLVGTTDFWNEQQECNDYNNNVETIFQEDLRPKRDCAQQKKQIDDRKKEKKNNIDRQTKDILRNNKNADLTGLNAITDQIVAAFVQADTMATVQCDADIASALQDITSDLNTYFQDWYSLSNEVNEAANSARRTSEGKKQFEKDITRQCTKDMSREMKNFEKEIGRAGKRGASVSADASLQSVRDVYTYLCTDLFGTMQTSLAAGDLDTFEDAKNEFYNTQQDFWNALNEQRGTVQEENQKAENLKNVQQDLKQKEKELKKMNGELGRLKKMYSKAAKKYADATERKEALAIIASFVGRAEELTGNMAAGIKTAKENAPTDPDSYWYDNNEDLNDLQQEFNEIQYAVSNYANIFQNLQEMEKTIKSDEKGLKRMKVSAEQKAALQDIIRRAKEYLSEAWSLAVQSPDDAMFVMESMKDLDQEWQETLGFGDDDDDSYEDGGYGDDSYYGPKY